MAITTTTELKTALAGYTHSDDLEGQFDNWISLAEARFNRAIRVRAMENTLASTALSSGAASLPTGFLSWKELRFDGAIDYTLQPKSLEFVRAMDPDDAGNPRYFAVTSTQVICWPTAGSIKGTYYKAPDSLVSNSSNWLLTSHPDLYLFACLEESAIYTRDFDIGKVWGTRTQVLLDEIQRTDDRDSMDGGLLVIRAR
jgi:hypothetical protein